MCNTSALPFGCANVETHCLDLSWLGCAHFMRTTASTAWAQTMLIESSGRWTFYNGLNVTGIVYGTSFSSTSDARLKHKSQDIPEEDSIN